MEYPNGDVVCGDCNHYGVACKTFREYEDAKYCRDFSKKREAEG